jgi:hypothetical protein
MPTWKRKDKEGNLHFQFLCSSCSRKKQVLLEKEEWLFVRDGEPASCNDCVLNCSLTARELWGAEDQVRYAVCEQCPRLDACPLKGRYYC